MYLKIPKDCFVRQYKETAFGYGGMFRPNTDHYVFRLPGAEYDGYTFTVPSDFGRFDAVQTLGDWYSVYVSSDDLPILVKRTENREDGKRYKQYKLTPAELNRIYGNSFKHAVAHVSVYADDGTRRAANIVNTKYVVGIVDGCWLMCDEFNKRRRIGTKGVDLLGYIDPTDAQDVKDLIKQHKKSTQRIHEQKYEARIKISRLERIDEIVGDVGMAELAQIKEFTANATNVLNTRIKASDIEFEKELDEFMKRLESYFLPMADAV